MLTYKGHINTRDQERIIFFFICTLVATLAEVVDKHRVTESQRLKRTRGGLFRSGCSGLCPAGF